MGWFKREQPAPKPLSRQDQGLLHFDNCRSDVQYVEILNYTYDEPTERKSDIYIVPASGVGTVKVRRDNEEGAGTLYAGSGAVLHCPLTEDGREVSSSHTNYNGQDRAYQSLRENAARLVCANCSFSDKSLLEIRTEQAMTAQAELDVVEAMKARALALQELTEIDPAFKAIH